MKELNIPATTSINQTDRTTTEVLTVNELVGTCQDVAVTFSTNDPTNVTDHIFDNNHICETLDLTLFTNVDNFRYETNNITSVIFPTSTKLTTSVRFESNSISGSLDLSVLSNLAGDIRFTSNSITSVLLPTNSNTINFFIF